MKLNTMTFVSTTAKLFCYHIPKFILHKSKYYFGLSDVNLRLDQNDLFIPVYSLRCLTQTIVVGVVA